MKLSLLVKRAQGGFQEIPIRLPQFLIGRDPDCHLRPVSPLVSKRHCAIIIREGKAFLKDFESTNGTLHNGRLLKGEIELADGDEFKVGPLVFKVKLVQESTGSSAKLPRFLSLLRKKPLPNQMFPRRWLKPDKPLRVRKNHPQVAVTWKT
jgi:pSer/pThr/pTyr-binding forkhead associated (FHA) protein